MKEIMKMERIGVEAIVNGRTRSDEKPMDQKLKQKPHNSVTSLFHEMDFSKRAAPPQIRAMILEPEFLYFIST